MIIGLHHIYPLIRPYGANKSGKCSKEDEVEDEIVTEFDNGSFKKMAHSCL